MVTKMAENLLAVLVYLFVKLWIVQGKLKEDTLCNCAVNTTISNFIETYTAVENSKDIYYLSAVLTKGFC